MNLPFVLIFPLFAFHFGKTFSFVPLQHKLFKSCIIAKGISADAIVERNSNCERYKKLNYQWNLRIRRFPWAYFLPKSTADVQIAVKCGRKSNVPLIPKSGGHSYESFSFGNSSALIVDFCKMNNVQINSRQGIATIGPGAQIGAVLGKLWEKGFGLPTGAHYKVGISGHALGGGNGLFAAKFGLLQDYIVEMTMVDASGKAHLVHANSNQDLFWALRGIGSGYIGIVTCFKFKLVPVEGLKISEVEINYPKNHIESVLVAYQSWLQWARENEPSVWTVIKINGSPGTDGVTVKTNYMTYESDGADGSERFLKMIPKVFPANGIYKESSYNFYDYLLKIGSLELQGNTSWREVGLVNIESYLENQYYEKAKSFYVSREATNNELRHLANIFRSIPREDVSINLVSFSGAISEVPPTKTSFIHRTSIYMADCVCIGPSCGNKGKQWLNQFVEKTRFLDNGESYQNSVDEELGGTYLARYYGRNLQDLLSIKKKWDPNNFLQNPESIPVFG